MVGRKSPFIRVFSKKIISVTIAFLPLGFHSIRPVWADSLPKPTTSEFLAELEGAAELEFFTLEPGNYYSKRTEDQNSLNKPHLQKFIILGNCNLRGQQKAELLKSFRSGIQNKKDRNVAHCFKPRHGFRFKSQTGPEYQVVICYECQKIWVVRSDGSGTSKRLVIFTTSEPQETFHKVAKEQKLQEAP